MRSAGCLLLGGMVGIHLERLNSLDTPEDLWIEDACLMEQFGGDLLRRGKVRRWEVLGQDFEELIQEDFQELQDSSVISIADQGLGAGLNLSQKQTQFQANP